MRVLSAGDEFQIMIFKARMTSLVNSKILEESPDLMPMKNNITEVTQYHLRKIRAKAREIEAQYIDNGSAIEIDKTVDARLNSPILCTRRFVHTTRWSN